MRVVAFGEKEVISVVLNSRMLASGAVLLLTASTCAGDESTVTPVSVVFVPSGDAQSAPHGRGNVYAPEVLLENGRYRMWFGGQGRDGHDRIQLAESQDGRAWRQLGVVLEDPTANHVNDPSVVKRGDSYFMYYSRAGTDIHDEIALATSSDGIHWSQRGVVLRPAAPGNWDSLLVGRPSVLFEGDRFRMWYDGRKDLPAGAPARGAPVAEVSTRAVGYAESRDGIHWSRPQTSPVFGENAGGVHVVRIGDGYVMVYESSVGTRFAASADGLRWKPKGVLAPRSGGDDDRHGHVTPFLLLGPNDAASLFVGGARNGRWDENIILRIDLNKSQVDLLHNR